jgi:hypothetical protein
MAKSTMAESIAEQLTECLRIRDQYSKSADYLKKLVSEHKELKKYDEAMDKQIYEFLRKIDILLEYIDTPIGSKPKNLSKRKLDEFDVDYGNFKQLLMKSTVVGTTSIKDMESITNLARSLRRMIYSFAKAQKITYHNLEENTK